VSGTHLSAPQFTGWRVLDCRTSQNIERVVWVDLDAATYAQHDKPARVIGGVAVPRVIRVSRIVRIDVCKTFAIAPTAGQERALRHQSARTDEATHASIASQGSPPVAPAIDVAIDIADGGTCDTSPAEFGYARAIDELAEEWSQRDGERHRNALVWAEAKARS